MMNIVNAKNVKRVSVAICLADGTHKGAGIGFGIDDKYFVLTAGHCLLDGSGNQYETSQISLKGGVNNLWKKSKIKEIKVAKDSDCAVLEIAFPKDCLPQDDKNILSSISILEEKLDYTFRLSGYIGDDNINFKVESFSENGDELHFQYLGAQIADLYDPCGIFKGLSGSGIYCQSADKLYVYAYLCRLSDNLGDNNELVCYKASRFLKLLPKLRVSKTEELHNDNVCYIKGDKTYFAPVKASLLKYEGLSKYPFISANKLDDILIALRDEENVAIMLTALSGMGKTRLLYEAFREDYDLNNCFFVKYYDSLEGVYSEAEQILRNKIEELGVLVIDDCPLELFEQLCDCVSRYKSNFRIIATNHDYFDVKEDRRWMVLRLQATDIRKEIDAFIDEQLQPDEMCKADVEEIKK